MTILINAAFVDQAMALFSQKAEVGDMVPALMGMLAILLWQNLSRTCLQYGEGVRERKLKETLQKAFLEKISNLEYRQLELSETQDLIQRVALAPEEHIKLTVESLEGLAILFLQNASVLWMVFLNVWWAGVFMIGGMVLLGILSLRAGGEDYQMQTHVTNEKRKLEYLSGVLLNKESALERTLFSYVPFVNGRYQRIFSQIYQKEKAVMKKWVIRGKTGGVVAALFAVSAMFLLLPGVKEGKMTPGLYISVITGVFSVINTITWNLEYHMKNLAKARAAIQDMTKFCALSQEQEEGEERVARKEMGNFESLEFRNVRFRYPGSGHDILKGVSFRLDAGKHYAFAGQNGAGKTTIMKLMLGLYPDYEGEIQINGKNRKECTRQEIRSLFACVWQDYAKYDVSVRENLCFDEKREEEELHAVLKQMGLMDTVEQLTNGLDTTLGRLDEEGTQLSGGQWQKLAIARAMIQASKGGRLLVLDEPAAALDPMAESRMYQGLGAFSKNEAAVFVTHRLGAVKHVDKIIVLEDGRVAEEGSHKALMERNGIYAKMYASQQEWYQ